MKPLDFILLALGCAGIALLYILIGTKLLVDWNRFSGLPRNQAARAVPFWIALLLLLSGASIIFSIHALLVTYGVLK
jgi:hypothetical protein